jgi:uncharacterized protein involved in exopolysaccharide biosynthesis
VNAFTISFVADTPDLAQAVTGRLTTLFIEQNFKTRADQAATTTRFLREQLQTTKQQLAEQEERLREFKMQYLGELPEQQQGNLGVLAGLHSQLDNVMGNLNRAQQQRLYLESLIGQYERIRSPRPLAVDSATVPSVVTAETPADRANRDLVRLRSELQSLLIRYTPRHPEVLAKKQEIEAQRRLGDGLAAHAGERPGETPERDQAGSGLPPSEPANQPVTTVEAESATVLAQLKSQLEANRLEINNLTKSESKLKTEVERYQSRLNLAPVREQQLSSLLRDYELIKESYADLLSKELESQLAANLEKRQEGQQLRLLDPPNLPTIPSSPKRMKLSLAGLAAGILLGVVAAFLFEFWVDPLHTEAEAAKRFGLLVVTLPVLATPREIRARAWWRAFEWTAATCVLLTLCAAQYYVYRNG